MIQGYHSDRIVPNRSSQPVTGVAMSLIDTICHNTDVKNLFSIIGGGLCTGGAATGNDPGDRAIHFSPFDSEDQRHVIGSRSKCPARVWLNKDDALQMLPFNLSSGGTLLCAENIPPEYIAYIVLLVDSTNIVLFDHAYVQYDVDEAAKLTVTRDVSKTEMKSALYNAFPEYVKKILDIMGDQTGEYESGAASLPRPN